MTFPKIRIFLLALLLAGCSSRADVQPRALDNPAGEQSKFPFLTTDASGRLFLSWLKVSSNNSEPARLFYASRDKGKWSEPKEIASGEDWFVNWADYPSVIANNGQPLAAHWLQKVPGNSYAYHIKMSVKQEGENWTKGISPHLDNTATEHGFVSMIPWQGQKVLAVWLDGRRGKGRAEDEYFDLQKAMTLRSAIIGPDGKITGSELIDDTVCDCCNTSVAKTGNGAIVAYRNRAEGEIRDIYVSRFENGKWSKGIAVYNDGWKIGACPVNGPKIVANGSTVFVAWFTGAKDTFSVLGAFSTDGGRTFGKPVRIDEGHPLGRLDAVIDDTGTAYVSWIEDAKDGAAVKVRKLKASATIPSKAFIVGSISQSRDSGFPQMELVKERLYFAWTQTDQKESRLTMKTVPVSLIL